MLGSPSHRLGSLAVALSLSALCVLTPSLAAAQNKLSFDAGAAFPAASGNDDGWGVGVRFGHEWDLLLLSITPEIGVSYHDFSGPNDATTFAGFGGGRVGIGFILEPSVFLHAGVGHLGGVVRHTSLAYDLGAALDITAIPVIDFGPHVMLSGIAGDENTEAFSWLEIGGHLTFNFGP
jgi:hypothetical protein